MTFKNNTLINHRSIAWILLILFWLVVLFNVAEYKKESSKISDIPCQKFMKEYCGIGAFMGSPFRICKTSQMDKSFDLWPLLIAVIIIFHWISIGAGKISSLLIGIQTFIIAKTNFTNDHYLISLIFYYATFSLFLYIIFYKDKNTKTIYTE